MRSAPYFLIIFILFTGIYPHHELSLKRIRLKKRIKSQVYNSSKVTISNAEYEPK